MGKRVSVPSLCHLSVAPRAPLPVAALKAMSTAVSGLTLDSEWMFADAASGLFGIQFLAHLNPLRWSGSQTCERTIQDLENVLTRTDRPILVKVPSGVSTTAQEFATVREAIDYVNGRLLAAERPAAERAREAPSPPPSPPSPPGRRPGAAAAGVAPLLGAAAAAPGAAAAAVAAQMHRPRVDYMASVVLLGDSGVGKTSLVKRFIEKRFTPTSVQTLGVDFESKMINVGEKTMKLSVWDTAGQEQFRTITNMYFRKAKGILLVYDVSSEASLASIREWKADVEQHCPPGTICLLAANKADFPQQERQVDAARGEAFARELGLTCMETSARSGLNVEEAFLLVAQGIRAAMDAESPARESPPSSFQLGGAGASSAPAPATTGGGECCA